MALLEEFVAARLTGEVAEVKAEGWRRGENTPDFPYGHKAGLRRLAGEETARSDAEHARRETLRDEVAAIEEPYFSGSDDDVPENSDRQLGEIEFELDAFETRPVTYDPGDVAIAKVNDADTGLLDAFAARRMPTVATTRVQAVTCHYTMLSGENFLIDTLPGEPSVVVCSACSGHGFKFSSGGEILADLSLRGGTDLPIAAFAFKAYGKLDGML